MELPLFGLLGLGRVRVARLRLLSITGQVEELQFLLREVHVARLRGEGARLTSFSLGLRAFLLLM
jgi:uncharacterized membrane protein (Fun14 family)